MGNSIDYIRDAAPGHRQSAVEAHYMVKGYHSNPTTLIAGAMEELGELAREVLLDDEHYVARPDKQRGDLEHEIWDVIVYLLALANAYNINLGV